MAELHWTYIGDPARERGRYLTAETETHLFHVDLVPSSLGDHAVNYRLIVSIIGRFDRNARSEHRFPTQMQAQAYAQVIADKYPAPRDVEEPDLCPECGGQDGDHDEDCINEREASYEWSQEGDR